MSASLPQTYLDDNKNKWHSASPLQGTGFGYSEYNWLSDAIRPDDFMSIGDNDGDEFGGGGGTGGGWISLRAVQQYFQRTWSGTGRYNINAGYSGGIHTGLGFNVTYVASYGTDVLVGVRFVTTERMAELLGGQIWYYAYEMGGMGHSLAFDPEMNAFYEKHFPYHGSGARLSVFFNNIIYGDRKSQGYIWYLNVIKQREDFWSFMGNRGNLLLAPVFVPNPSAARTFFQANEGNKVPYNLVSNNCKHYVLDGFRAGGTEISIKGPLPDNFGGQPFSMMWNVGALAPIPYTPPPALTTPNFRPMPYLY